MFVPFVHTSKVCIYISVCCLKDEAGFGICVLSYTRSIYFCLVCSVMIYMKDNLFLKQPILLFFVELKSIEICKRCLCSVWNSINIAWSTFHKFILAFPETVLIFYGLLLYFRMSDSFDGICTLKKLWEIRFCVLLHNQSFQGITWWCRLKQHTHTKQAQELATQNKICFLQTKTIYTECCFCICVLIKSLLWFAEML